MNGQLKTTTFEESFERNTTTPATVNNYKIYVGKMARTSLEKPQVYHSNPGLHVSNTTSTNIRLYDSEVSETLTTQGRDLSFSDEEIWIYLIDNDPDVIMPPKKSYHIKVNVSEVVRGKPSKAG